MSEEYQTGTYQIRNTSNGMVYVGGAYGSFKRRWKSHLIALQKGECHNPYLQRAWNKYGETSFVFEVLERCPASQCLIQELEDALLKTYWRDKTTPVMDHTRCYNICPYAETRKAVRLTKEHSQKIGAALTGIKRSEETKQKLRVANLGKKRAPCSEETREKRRIAGLGRTHSEETRKKIGASNKGKTKGRPHTEEHSANISKASVIRWQDLENREKQSENKKEYWQDKEATQKHLDNMTKANTAPERCAKVSKSQKSTWDDPVKRAARLAKCAATKAKNGTKTGPKKTQVPQPQPQENKMTLEQCVSVSLASMLVGSAVLSEDIRAVIQQTAEHYKFDVRTPEGKERLAIAIKAVETSLTKK